MHRSLPTLSALASAPPSAEGYLIDLDGTLVSGSALLPGALEFLGHLPGPFVILSNDSEHVASELVDLLGSQGLGIDSSRIVLSGVVAVETIAEQFPAARLMLLGSQVLLDLAEDRGLRLDNDRPDVVLLARDRGFSFAKLTAAARAVRQGARVVLACPDTSHPGPDGAPVPEVGALAAALFACVGDIPHEVIGKPEPTLFAIGCARLGIPAAQCIMIGDNPLTDGSGASRAGMRFLQVAP